MRRHYTVYGEGDYNTIISNVGVLKVQNLNGGDVVKGYFTIHYLGKVFDNDGYYIDRVVSAT